MLSLVPTVTGYAFPMMSRLIHRAAGEASGLGTAGVRICIFERRKAPSGARAYICSSSADQFIPRCC